MPPLKRIRFCPAAMTLIELLVVIAIIAILAGLLFPVVGRMKDRGNQAKCVSNMRMLGIAHQLHAAEHNGRVAAGATVGPAYGYSEGTNQLWQTDLLPYLGIASGTANKPTRSEMNFVFNCPSVASRESEFTKDQTTYALNWIMPNNGATRQWYGYLIRVKNPSRTILMTETPPANTDYVRAVDMSTTIDDEPALRHGAENPSNPKKFTASGGYDYFGEGKANTLFVDGHVEALDQEALRWSIPGQLWWPQ